MKHVSCADFRCLRCLVQDIVWSNVAKYAHSNALYVVFIIVEGKTVRFINSSFPNPGFAFHFLDDKRGMIWITLKQREGFGSLLLNVFGKCCERFSKSLCTSVDHAWSAEATIDESMSSTVSKSS